MATAFDLWTVGGASVIGASHHRKGVPNQDGIAWLPTSGAARRVVLAVSDGHGAAPHFRSEIGSRLANEAAIEVIEWFFDAPDLAEAAAELPDEIVACWQQRVRAHAAAHPFEGTAAEGDPLTPYGATCIAAGLAEDRIVLCQIGDGDLLLGLPDGRFTKPLPDDQLPGEQTYSLCLPDAARHARVRLLRRDGAVDWPDFVMLSTDGVAKSFADHTIFEEIGRRFRRLARDDFAAALNGLPDWLSDVTRRGSGDDVSLCLAVRSTET